MNQLCERCRMHPATVIVAELHVCEPCASILEWSYGIVRDHAPPPEFADDVVDDYVTGGIGDLVPTSPIDLLIPPPIRAAKAFGVFDRRPASSTPGLASLLSAPSPVEKQPEGFPWFKLMLVVGGVAAVGTAGFVLVRLMEGARETQREAKDFIKEHPQVLAALL